MATKKHKDKRARALVILSEPPKPQVKVEEKRTIVSRQDNIMLTRISVSSQLQYEREILGHAIWFMASASGLLLLYIAIISLP